MRSVSSFLSRCLQPPAPVAVRTALELLVNLGALTVKEELTELGEYLAALPLDPSLGKMILFGAAFQCLDPILTVASCLAYRDPFVLPLEQDRRAAGRSASGCPTALSATSSLCCTPSTAISRHWPAATARTPTARRTSCSSRA